MKIAMTSGRVGTRAATAAAAAAIAAGSLLIAVPAAGASPAPAAAERQQQPVAGSMLRAGEKMDPGKEIKSASGRFKLRQALDGNLFFLDGTTLVWNTGTAPNSGASTHLQEDGNLVVRSARNEPLWHSATQGENLSLHVQDDGNLTIRTPSGEVEWALSEVLGNDAKLRPGEALRTFEERHSLNKKFTLRMQGDGNLVLLEAATKKPVWHSGTGARDRKASAHMQLDGNLVIYSEPDRRPLWDTATQAKDVTLHVQNDGNLTMWTPDGKVLWSRG